MISSAAHTGPAVPRLPVARWSILAGLLALEALLIATRFDAEPLLAGETWWTALLGRAGAVVALLAYLAAGLLLVGMLRPRAPEAAPAVAVTTSRWWWLFLTGHLVAFTGFVWLTAAIFGEDIAPADISLTAVAAWAVAGLASVALWGEAMLPGRALLPLVRRAPSVIVAGFAVGAAAWAAGMLTDEWWIPLGSLTLDVVHALLGLVADPVLVDPAEFVIGTQEFTVKIMPGCSGYQGIGLIWVFLGGYLWVFRRVLRFPQALLLLPVGTVIVWLANALRIFLLIVIGSWVSPAIALGGFHHSAGALLFCAVALGLVTLARRSHFLAADATTVTNDPNPTAAYLAPLLALVATAATTSLLSTGGLDLLYPLRVLVTGAVLAACWRRYHDLAWTWSWTAAAAGTVVFPLWIAFTEEPAGAAAVGLPALATPWLLAWTVFRIAGAVVTVPLAEEIAFRGYLTRRLVAPDFERVAPGFFTWPSFLVSSLLFGAMHSSYVAGTLAGMIYAGVWYRRGRLMDAVVAHAVTNALLAGYVLATGSYWLWG